MSHAIALDPDAAPAPAVETPQGAGHADAHAEGFSFSGRAGEYFRIWIVNLFLTVVTLGIYSAWAKVRKKRYLYGNTWVAGANFEYHGNPVAILKGRLIAFAAFVAYTGVTHFWPRLGAALLVVMLVVAPWLLVRSFAFNAANSSYRNLRFAFDGSYREGLAAVAPLVVLPVATLLLPQIDRGHPPTGLRDMWMLFVPTLLFAVVFPYVVARVKLLQANRSRFGNASFACDAGVGRFYGTYFLAALLFLGVMMVAGVLSALAALVSPMLLMAIMGTAYLAGFVLALAYVRARIANHVFNATRLAGGVALESRLRARSLARIYFFNLFAIALTLGLAVPWAAMRVARYRAESLALRAGGDLESFVALAGSDVAATGEAMGEMFDIDISL